MEFFSASDIQQIQSLGLSQDAVLGQVETLSKPSAYVKLIAPAKQKKGILSFTEQEIDAHLQLYNNIIREKKLLKFVPASGVASRMFKDLFLFLENNQDVALLQSIETLMRSLKKMPIYDALKKELQKKNMDIENLIYKKEYKTILEYLLSPNGLNYAHLPKGLLLFHRYENENRTAFEEHLVEGSLYTDNNSNVNLHFTISPEHTLLFKEIVEKIRDKYENQFKTKYNIHFSTQAVNTNTISLDEQNQPFRNEDGTLDFRPGGHGSLLQNLEQSDADVIFVKNIDNVTFDTLRQDTIRYKKLLCVLLLKTQNQCFEYLKLLDNENLSEEKRLEIEDFAKQELNIIFPKEYDSLSVEDKKDFLHKKLNRPIRVCGMVKRENEPGGGPFWIANKENEISLQIVETAEIDTSDTEQEKILEDSQFFNPVDLVCGIKNYKGETFDLQKHIDQTRCFVSLKSKNGKTIKVLEHPGLWNGAMSDWNTIFVAVPLSTFTPVKSIFDLLRKEHLNEG